MTVTIPIQEMQELLWKGNTKWFSHVDSRGDKQTHHLTYQTEEELNRRLKNVMETLTAEELLTFKEEPIHRLNANYTREFMEDLKSMHDVDAEKILDEIIVNEINDFIKRNQ